jgi:uncharacterized protein involved in type VI secretion and phage assembly
MIKQQEEQMQQHHQRFYGKYRGKVTANKDELRLGRIRATVPAVFGSDRETGWALPAVPYAGKGVGFFFIPPEKANVWIEFEGGDPDIPIWSGCFWDKGEILPDLKENKIKTPDELPGLKVIKTDFVTITFNDTIGERKIVLENSAGFKIVMDTQQIELSKNRITIRLNSDTVSINGDALEIR